MHQISWMMSTPPLLDQIVRIVSVPFVEEYALFIYVETPSYKSFTFCGCGDAGGMGIIVLFVKYAVPFIWQVKKLLSTKSSCGFWKRIPEVGRPCPSLKGRT